MAHAGSEWLGVIDAREMDVAADVAPPEIDVGAAAVVARPSGRRRWFVTTVLPWALSVGLHAGFFAAGWMAWHGAVDQKVGLLPRRGDEGDEGLVVGSAAGVGMRWMGPRAETPAAPERLDALPGVEEDARAAPRSLPKEPVVEEQGQWPAAEGRIEEQQGESVIGLGGGAEVNQFPQRAVGVPEQVVRREKEAAEAGGRGGVTPAAEEAAVLVPPRAAGWKEGAAPGRRGAAAGVDGGGFVQPVYSEESRRRGEEGAVELEWEVSEDGGIGQVSVVQDPGYERLVKAAVDAVKATKFVPATRGGRPVAYRLRKVFRFVLK
jgi:TonB family protein